MMGNEEEFITELGNIKQEYIHLIEEMQIIIHSWYIG